MGGMGHPDCFKPSEQTEWTVSNAYLRSSDSVTNCIIYLQTNTEGINIPLQPVNLIYNQSPCLWLFSQA